MQTIVDYDQLIAKAEKGIQGYIDHALEQGHIDAQLAADAGRTTMPNLKSWLLSSDIDRISPNAKSGIAAVIEAGRWEDLVNAYRHELSFGTGGIRGMMAFDRQSIENLDSLGLDAPILKGPNTINNLVLLRVSAGVAQFGKDKGFSKIVIGCDSRIRGGDFAEAIAGLFLANGYTVYLFDEPCPYPEVTFAIPYEEIKADIGILISASHNDYRYNGYKLSCCNGSQFDPEERDEMYWKYISTATFADVHICPLSDAPEGKLVFLGGANPVEGRDYGGRPRLNIHAAHRDHILSQLTDTPQLTEYNASPESLRIGYCAFHGVGRRAVPRLLKEAGFQHVSSITKDGLNELNGLFPSFNWQPGHEQQPDPGDKRAATIALAAFESDYPGELANTDVIIGTDPDADRCGVIVRVPENQRQVYAGEPFALIPADDMWALIVWFRLMAEVKAHGQVIDPQTKFIVQSATTTDAVIRLARKHGLGTIRTWVGFANLAAATRLVWDGKTIPDLHDGYADPHDLLCHPFVCDWEGITAESEFNYAAMEQSNGWSILGGRPPDERSLGAGGHVRDKDGTLAAILVAEIAAYAKAHGTTVFEMIDKHIYLDPDIGLFVNHYEPDPLDGEYPGIEGDRKKIDILHRALSLLHLAKAGDLQIGSHAVTDTVIHRTGKYDHLYPATHDFQFPDEGIRFYLDGSRLNTILIRPSGTGNSLRFHAQLHADVSEQNLIAEKQRLRDDALAIMDDLREKLGALREHD